VDACRHIVRDAGRVVPLATRPVLFALVRALGEAWPGDVPRSMLVARAFRAKRASEVRSCLHKQTFPRVPGSVRSGP
jgi:hypothetical protein